MKEEYNLLNGVEIDFSQYKEEEVDEIEKKRMMKKFKKSNKKEVKFRNKAIITAVVALLIAANMSMTKNNENVFGFVDNFKYSISNWLGLKDENNKYTAKIHKTVEEIGTKVAEDQVVPEESKLVLTLNEFFTDNNRVVVNFDINMNKKELDNQCFDLVPDLYVNGEERYKNSIDSFKTVGPMGYSVKLIKKDENSGEEINNVGIEFYVDGLNLTKNENIKLVFSILAIKKGIDEKKFTFDFKYDVSNYKKDCKVVEVNKTININGSTLQIDKVIVAPDRISIEGTENGFSKATSTLDQICSYDIYDQNGQRVGLKLPIGYGAFFHRNGSEITSLKIVPWTYQQIETNNIKVDDGGKTIYIAEDQTIFVDLK
ncbi:hypothetical protein Clocel_1097 [Clostridium cellulovorans 743B]|uniref:DUF4179 domain-containing protein n=1 Tax=Clostridium cellulovorans (strain ATCC 35296 / DSM 3052 / OCM 3 / 743B) TaxID=573061 RepID=D9SU18_CLOC7|nr:hypothetical protein Clocel_1097 [Clostridium cellulovorans 743B]